MATTTPSPPVPPMRPDPVGAIEGVAGQLKELLSVDWNGLPGEAANHALVALEGVNRAYTALQSEIIGAAEAEGVWAQDGHRSFVSWFSNNTGTARGSSSRAVKLSKSLRNDLPHTRHALAEGAITRDHAELIGRKCTQTEKHRQLLLDPECGEEFLIESAK